MLDDYNVHKDSLITARYPRMRGQWDTNSIQPRAWIGGRGIRERCLLLNLSVNLKPSKNTTFCITGPSQTHPLGWAVF